MIKNKFGYAYIINIDGMLSYKNWNVNYIYTLMLWFTHAQGRFFFFCLDGNNGSKDKEKTEDIEERLRDISKRLEKLGSCNSAKIHHPPPDMKPMDDTTKEILFTRLFPTVRHQAISFH